MMRHEKLKFQPCGIKLTIIALGVLVVTSAFRFTEQPKPPSLFIAENVALKRAALVVLETKCNVCHQRQNPWKVFTIENMSGFAPKIHQQVFVKKRMPKGDQQKLTSDEYNTLKKWLSTEKSIQHGN